MNLAAAFIESAEKQKDRPALFYGEKEFSYSDLYRQTRLTAKTLSQKMRILPGERVGIWLKNCPEYIPSFFGILMCGGVVVPINNFLKPEELIYIVKNAGIKLLISEQGMAATLQSLAAKCPGLSILTIEEVFSEEKPFNGTDSLVPRREEDLAVIIFTSGTTGRPKGAMLTHRNLLHNVESCRQVLEAVPYDRFVLLLPMFHSFMLCVGILLPLIVGGSIVLIKSVHPAKSIFQEIIARQATILPAIPQIFRTLASAPPPPNFPLRLCISGAAPLPVEINKEFHARFPIPLLEGYGLSEASPVVTMNPIHGPWKIGSIGRPIPDVEVTIQDENGAELAVGEVGELCVRGGNVMAGYWEQPEETAKALRDGWLLTGDVGYRDADGYFFITDRKKDMLLVNGINVYPREVEEVLYTFTGVKEAAVVGIPDERRGEQPVAFVVPNEGASLNEREMIAFVRARLADYKVPRRIEVLASLPRNATGKILKTSLREMIVG
jgi:long-chain acyl-CoA synthetase